MSTSQTMDAPKEREIAFVPTHDARKRIVVTLLLPVLLVGCTSSRGPFEILTAQRIPEVGRGAPRQYVVRASPYAFTTDFEFNEDDPLVGELTVLRDVIAEKLELPVSDRLIRVVIFADRNRYEEYFARNFPELPSRRAFFIREGESELAVFACRGDRLRQDLRHEVTHAILHASNPRIPYWLDEGLAEYFESADLEGAVNPRHVANLRARSADRSLNLERLERIDDLRGLTSDDYRESWLWVHYCLEGNPAGLRVLIDEVHDAGRAGGRLGFRDRLLAVVARPEETLQMYLQSLASGDPTGPMPPTKIEAFTPQSGPATIQ